MVPVSPSRIGLRDRLRSEPRGVIRDSSIGRRSSFASDSGSTTIPYSMLSRFSAAATTKGARTSRPPTRPPSAGPRMNPSPNAAPTRPKLCARFSGGVMSAMYAVAAEKLAPVIPARMRPTNSQPRFGASAVSR